MKRHGAGQPPAGHRQGGFRGADRCRLRLYVALAPKMRARLGEHGVSHQNLGNCGAEVCFFLVDDLNRGGAGFQQRDIALQILLDLVACGLRIGQIGLRLENFGRLGRTFQIDHLVLCLRQLPRRLIAGGQIVGVVLVEQGRAFDNFVTALDVDGGQ